MYNNLGNVLRDQGQLDEAAAQYERAVALKPGLVPGAQQPGQRPLAAGQARPGRGTRLSKRWLSGRILPRRTTTWAASCRLQGKLDEAAARFEQAVALNPSLFQAHDNLGNVLRDQGKLDQAAARFEQALALRPDVAETHNNLGNILWQQGKLEQAAARFEQALATRPDYAEAHNNLGCVFQSQDKLDEAAAQFEQAAVLKPNLVEAHNNLGTALRARANSPRQRPSSSKRWLSGPTSPKPITIARI